MTLHQLSIWNRSVICPLLCVAACWHGDARWCALQGDAVDQPIDVVYDVYTVSEGAGIDAAADCSQAPIVYVSSLLCLLLFLLYTTREGCMKRIQLLAVYAGTGITTHSTVVLHLLGVFRVKALEF